MVEKTHGLPNRKQAVNVVKENCVKHGSCYSCQPKCLNAVMFLPMCHLSGPLMTPATGRWAGLGGASGQTGQPSVLAGCWRGLGLGFGMGHTAFSTCHPAHGVGVHWDGGCS